MRDLLTFLLGVVFAAAGGELFVRGTVNLGRWAGISPALLAMTLAALATSSPELAVSLGAALLGKPAVGFGDVLGSNVVNISLVLGSAVLLRSGGIRVSREILHRDYPLACIIPLATWYFISDGVVEWGEGLVFLGVFVLWLILSLREAMRQRSGTRELENPVNPWPSVLLLIVGLGCLIGAGELVVTGAKGLALRLGIDEFIVGALIVSFGTSVPELATVMVSRVRGHDEVGVGTVLGSNILNGLLIVGIAALITPIRINPLEAGIILLFGIASLLLVWPAKTGLLGRSRGIALLTLYGLWMFVLIHGF